METDYDSPWKEAISLYFEDFLSFFFPDIHADIDWSETPQFLESEFQALTGYSDEADHLFQSMSISRSDSCRSLVPIHADHRFQLNAIGA